MIRDKKPSDIIKKQLIIVRCAKCGNDAIVKIDLPKTICQKCGGWGRIPPGPYYNNAQYWYAHECSNCGGTGVL